MKRPLLAVGALVLAAPSSAQTFPFEPTHLPYKGAAPALSDLMDGQTDFMSPMPQAALPLRKGGKLRALAVSFAKRLPVMPDVPTVAGYPGFEAFDWKVLFAPAKLPADMTKRLLDEVETARGKPEAISTCSFLTAALTWREFMAWSNTFERRWLHSTSVRRPAPARDRGGRSRGWQRRDEARAVASGLVRCGGCREEPA